MRGTVVELTVLGAEVAEDTDALTELGVRRSSTRTVLDVVVRDQAALYGLLQRLASLGLDLVELRTVPSGERPAVEVVVRGPVGALVRAMLGEVSSVSSGVTTAYRVREVDVASVLAEAGRAVALPALGEASPCREGDGGSEPSRQGAVRGETATGERPMDDEFEMGPIDYIVVEFADNRLDGTALPLLIDLVDRGIIRVLDLAFVAKDDDGEVAGVEWQDLDVAGDFDPSVFAGASSSLLGEDDVREVGAVLRPGSAAGILVYENSWAGPFAAALRRGGGTLVATGRIPVQSLVAALDAAEDR